MATLKQQFGDVLGKRAFSDNGRQIDGKQGRIIQLDGGLYDCWFVGPELAPLGTRRLNNIRQQMPEGVKFSQVDGEAWAQGITREFVLLCARLIGAPRKRQLSPEQKRAGAERLRKAREGKDAPQQ